MGLKEDIRGLDHLLGRKNWSLTELNQTPEKDKELGGPEHFPGQDGGDEMLINAFLDDLPTNTRFEKYVVVNGQEQYWFGLLGNPDEFVPKRPGKHLNYAQDNSAGTQLQRMLKDLKKAAPRGWIPQLRGMRVVYVSLKDDGSVAVQKEETEHKVAVAKRKAAKFL